MTDHGADFPACPLPISQYPRILMAHGGGGKLMHELIGRIFATAFANPDLVTTHDGAVVDMGGNKVVFTTDSFVVHPLFFPGGDIGSLAVNGTVNDLAMCGAAPKYLSAGFIVEEGLEIEVLWKVAMSMARAAETADVRIVTGDTKVVDRGRGDGVYINTAGIGLMAPGADVAPHRITAGDIVILSGDVGRHGMAVMAEREGLAFESEIRSDCAPWAEPVARLLEAGIDIHCLRDLTRGGLATTLVELSEAANCHIAISEHAVEVIEPVRGACEILGFDPLYVANEGRFAAFIPPDQADQALGILHDVEVTGKAAVIGRVTDEVEQLVTMRSAVGAERILDMLSGEQLPRIC